MAVRSPEQRKRLRQHLLFWEICKKRSTVTEDGGESLDTLRSEDRCGSCVHFHPLERTDRGWGVCASKASDRTALLTFMNMRCRLWKPLRDASKGAKLVLVTRPEKRPKKGKHA